MTKYKNWDDESDDYIPFEKVSKKPKIMKTDPKEGRKKSRRDKNDRDSSRKNK